MLTKATPLGIRKGVKPLVGIIGAPADICRAVEALAGAPVVIIVISSTRTRAGVLALLGRAPEGLLQFETAEPFPTNQWSDLDVLVNASPAAHPLLFEAVAHSVPLVTVESPYLTPMFSDGCSALFLSNRRELIELVTALVQDATKRKALAHEALRCMQREYAMSYIKRDYREARYAASDLRPGPARSSFKRLIINAIPNRWLVTHGNSTRQEFAITFDDGPDPVFTPPVLKILRNFDVTATFYVVGNRVEQFPELVQAIAADGHEVANHSYTHPFFDRIPWRRAKQELTAADRAIRATGVDFSKQLRPPFGRLSIKTLLLAWSMGLTVVMWSADLKDFAALSPNEIVKNLGIANICNGDIVLYHASNHSALSALPTVLAQATRGGRRGVTVSELMQMRT